MTNIRKNATKTLKKKKNAARQKRKLILFQARLVQLKDAGIVTVEGHGAQKAYTFEEETLANMRELQRQTGERTANKINSLQRYDVAVLMLYPKPASLNEIPASGPNNKLAWPNKRPITDPDMQVDVFKFAEYIGFTRSHARYILDQEYAGKLPTYTSFCMLKDEAIKFTAEHGGLYFLYQYDHNELAREQRQSLGVVTRASVSVRCPVPYMFTRSGDEVGSRYARVRCKINIPGYDNVESDPTKDPYKFDGFVTPNGSWWQCLLQARPNRNRGEHRGDLMVTYTEAMVKKA